MFQAKCQGKEHMIESEIAILSAISHPNIIKLEEVFDFASEKYLVMEYVSGGDLFDSIAHDIKYTEAVARDMIKDLADALQVAIYTNYQIICLENIFLAVSAWSDDLPSWYQARKFIGNWYAAFKGNVETAFSDAELLTLIVSLQSLKLADFGLAVVVREPLFTVCGTPTYVAPEILAETGYGVKVGKIKYFCRVGIHIITLLLQFQVDVWAVGVILYILLCGYPPFSSRTNNQEELFDQILSGLFEFNSPDWDDISYPAKELISWSLVVDPLQRYSAKEILQHPWILNSDQDDSSVKLGFSS